MKRFDDRQLDFLTGKRVSPPMDERRVCDCCGQRIVKGWVRDNGDQVGDDCMQIINRADTAKVCFSKSADDFAADWKRATGCVLKPAVLNYLRAA